MAAQHYCVRFPAARCLAVLLAVFLTHAALAFDFGSDGRSDVLWRNGVTGENYIYPLSGLKILLNEGYVRTVPDQNWRVVGIGDFNDDGHADLLWRNAGTGENYIYLMNETAIIGEGYIRTVADPYWQVAGVGDFDADGKADILWRNLANGQNYLYLMDGLTIKPGEGFIRTVADPAWRVVGVADFNGDGRADILWRNLASGQNYLYPMLGLSILPGEGFIRTVADPAWRVAGVGDFNNDGRADILWRNSTTGENYVYPMNGTAILGTEGYLRTVPDQSWQVAAVGNYNGVGGADILWRNSATGQNYLYMMSSGTTIVEEGFLRTVADQAWVAIGRSPPVEFEALPAVPDLVSTFVDLTMGTQQFPAPWACTGNPQLNCTSGVPLDPLPLIEFTRGGYSIAPTPNPLVYDVSVQGNVRTLSPLAVRVSGTPFGTINCSVSVDTTRGATPLITVSGTVIFGQQVPGGPINRVEASNLDLVPIENADINISGGLGCALGDLFFSFIVAQVKPHVQSAVENVAKACGAPGAPLFVACP